MMSARLVFSNFEVRDFWRNNDDYQWHRNYPVRVISNTLENVLVLLVDELQVYRGVAGQSGVPREFVAACFYSVRQQLCEKHGRTRLTLYAGERMTEEIFRDDPYIKTANATVLAVEEGGIELNRSIFYPTGGGQPGDTGVLRTSDGREVVIGNTLKDRISARQMHVPVDDAPDLAVGDLVTMEIDWERRYRFMRMHTLLHLICATVDAEITGCQIGREKSRIDLNIEEKPDKEVIQTKLDELVARDLLTSAEWITEEELAAKPELVKTMSVHPPSGFGKVRMMAVEEVDLQPCGGTHVARTGEIGNLRVGKIENKGKHNRRLNVHLED